MRRFLTWHMATVNMSINMHSAVKYWLHRILVRPHLIWAQQFTGEAENTCCYIEFQVPFLRLNGRRNDKWHQRGVDAKTGQRTAERICFSSGWVQLARRKHEARFVTVILHQSCIWQHQGDFIEMRREVIEEERVKWRDESCDHDNTMQWRHCRSRSWPCCVVFVLCLFPVITGCGHPLTRECSGASI